MITEAFGINNTNDLGNQIIIPNFKQKKINLKKVNKKEDPFKIIQELDSIFEAFLDSIAKEVVNGPIISIKTIKDQEELKIKINKLESIIKDENFVETDEESYKLEEYYFMNILENFLL